MTVYKGQLFFFIVDDRDQGIHCIFPSEYCATLPYSSYHAAQIIPAATRRLGRWM